VRPALRPQGRKRRPALPAFPDAARKARGTLFPRRRIAYPVGTGP